MLVLSAKPDGRFYLDNGRIVVTVIEAQPGKVRLGFEADRSIPIDREEVHQRKAKDRRQEPPEDRAA